MIFKFSSAVLNFWLVMTIKWDSGRRRDPRKMDTLAAGAGSSRPFACVCARGTPLQDRAGALPALPQRRQRRCGRSALLAGSIASAGGPCAAVEVGSALCQALEAAPVPAAPVISCVRGVLEWEGWGG